MENTRKTEDRSETEEDERPLSGEENNEKDRQVPSFSLSGLGSSSFQAPRINHIDDHVKSHLLYKPHDGRMDSSDRVSMSSEVIVDELRAVINRMRDEMDKLRASCPKSQEGG